MRHHLGSNYPGHISRRSDKVMLLIMSVTVIVKNSNEIRTITCEPDKYPETQGMNKTKVWLQDNYT